MQESKRLWARLALASTLGLTSAAYTVGAAAAGAAATFPTQPVRLMVATTAGGTADTLARAISEHLSAAWKQPVIVEQRVGANGMIAAGALARAKPDGHTAYFSLSSMVQNVLLQQNPGYSLDDVVPVSKVAVFPIAAALNASVPANTLDELLELARQKPDELIYGSYGMGSGGHIVGAGLTRAAGVSMVHVPYAGEAAGFPDLVSGRLSMFYASMGFLSRQVDAGKIRLLAVTAPERLKHFPDVPTFKELGYPGVNLPGWSGVFLPKGTPQEVVDKFSEAMQQAVATPQIQKLIYDFGFVPDGGTAEAFAQDLAREVDAWRTVITENEIKLD